MPEIYLLALLLGVVAGLRTMMPPAMVSWAAYLGRLDLGGSWLAFLASPWTSGILTLLALAELVADQLPSTPSRKVPPAFAARVISGAVCGAALGIPSGSVVGGLLAGAVGAVVGTLGGHALRMRLAAALGSDRPAAIIEDVIAIAAAVLIGVFLT